ncbi:hypothetical protein GQ600_16812 [Phytophthora cactorum]|nr:hypothetical protein GQ600_16812 [Phytophthora cactorum]
MSESSRVVANDRVTSMRAGFFRHHTGLNTGRLWETPIWSRLSCNLTVMSISCDPHFFSVNHITDLSLHDRIPSRSVAVIGMGDSLETLIARTQEQLQPLIAKPKLADKLLAKPPFRFLHDVFTAVTQSTGFAKGLYNDFESGSANLKDKPQKTAFLDKMIVCVGQCLGEDVDVRSSKIVAGLEPENTNLLLQSLAQAAKDTSLTGTRPGNRKGRAGSFSGPKKPLAVKSSAGDADNDDDGGNLRFEAKTDDGDDAGARMGTSAPGTSGTSRTSRPTTARRRPPKLKENVTEVGRLMVPDAKAAPVAGIMKDGDNNETDSEDEAAAGDDASNQPHSALLPGDAGAHGRLVRDILKDQNAEEAARRAKEGEDTAVAAATEAETGIRLGRRNKSFKPEHMKSSSAAAASSLAEMNALRADIQRLCQAANPVGKSVEFVHEDLDAMSKELEFWRKEYARKRDALADEQKRTEEALQPLQVQLREVEEQVKEQLHKINTLKAVIAKNEEKTQQLLRMVLRPRAVVTALADSLANKGAGPSGSVQQPTRSRRLHSSGQATGEQPDTDRFAHERQLRGHGLAWISHPKGQAHDEEGGGSRRLRDQHKLYLVAVFEDLHSDAGSGVFPPHLMSIVDASCCFVDTDGFITKACAADWKQCKIDRFVKDPIRRREVEVSVTRWYRTVCNAYRRYCGHNVLMNLAPLGSLTPAAAMQLQNDVTCVPWPGYTEFLSEAKILDESSEYCSLPDLENVFVAANLELTQEAKEKDNPDRSLTRFEFLECIIRIATNKYFRNRLEAFANAINSQRNHPKATATSNPRNRGGGRSAGAVQRAIIAEESASDTDEGSELEGSGHNIASNATADSILKPEGNSTEPTMERDTLMLQVGMSL